MKLLVLLISACAFAQSVIWLDIRLNIEQLVTGQLIIFFLKFFF